jgi:hypothetical protein
MSLYPPDDGAYTVWYTRTDSLSPEPSVWTSLRCTSDCVPSPSATYEGACLISRITVTTPWLPIERCSATIAAGEGSPAI